MGYYSYCTGFVKPADSLGELVEALKKGGFTLDWDGSIYSLEGAYTGFNINERSGMIVACEESYKTYGFRAFIEKLQTLSSLIAEASLTREGENNDDRESYEFDGSQWYVELRPRFMVPVDRTAEALDRFEQVRLEFQKSFKGGDG